MDDEGLVLSQPPTESRTPNSAAAVVSASVLAITDDPVVKDLLLEMALHDGFGVRCANGRNDEQLDRAGNGQGEEHDRETHDERAHRCLVEVRVNGAPPGNRC